jgi:hypothetical protein
MGEAVMNEAVEMAPEGATRDQPVLEPAEPQQ